MSEAKKIWTATISQEDHRKFAELADKHGGSMVSLLRKWVRENYRKLERERAA